MVPTDDAPDLGELFHAAFRGLRRTWSEQLAPWELTPHQWRALLTLMRRHPDVPTHPVGPAEAADAGGEAAAGAGNTAGVGGDGAGGDGGGCSAGRSDVRLKDLAGRLRIAPRSATEVVDQLEVKGLVRRDPDPTDRRATLIVATAAGQKLFADIQAERRDKSTEYFSRLNLHDHAELARILGQLHD
ncbi:MarR family winged helix-turn-helix transcriptional regulator [Arthrobacter sp. H35-D1]|uniref:MarR family winged helix-turn-helix transcriptional regulator n=1 Tax=Arthrobacter sp. H35-D1 TaxID=3046202 RepID=UPI0024B8DF57|nr:MarR family winged helix-turn-helix transcriptional regulator [Arthrobacter sp. H35-D1]MDJ0311944.1 MarR family winged helix-turn-helix transcriptional regulator [Arthrobacter sp. H35-D1]